MSLILRQTLAAARRLPAIAGPPISAAILHSIRHRSTRSGEGQLVEVELRETEGGSGEVEVVGGMSKLEEAICNIESMSSAPDWLPFLPGSSYPVLPRNSSFAYKVLEVIGRIANRLTVEERLAFMSGRGWPSPEYFLEGVDINSEDDAVKSRDDTETAVESGDENA